MLQLTAGNQGKCGKSVEHNQKPVPDKSRKVYCDMPGSPCLSKKGESKDPWPRVLSLPERFIGDPASLARDNIYQLTQTNMFLVKLH